MIPPSCRFFLLLLLFLVLGAMPVRADEMRVLRDLTIEPGQTTEDVICFFCAVHVKGKVDEDVVVLWAGVDVEGEVRGDVVVLGGGVRVRPGGKIAQDVITIAGPIVREEGGIIGEDAIAKVWFHLPGQRQVFWRGAVAWLGGLLVVAFLQVLFFGARRVYNQAQYIGRYPIRCLLVGVAIFAAIIGLYMVTGRLGKYADLWGLGITALWAILIVLGFAATCSWLAQALLSTSNMLALALAGALLIGALSLIPLAGLLVFSVIMFAAMSVPLLSLFGSKAPDSEIS